MIEKIDCQWCHSNDGKYHHEKGKLNLVHSICDVCFRDVYKKTCTRCANEYERRFVGMYCPNCGFLFSNQYACPSCKKPAEPNTNFCTYCGKSLD